VLLVYCYLILTCPTNEREVEGIMRSKVHIEITDKERANHVIIVLTALEELDDVQEVYTTAVLST
jgi:transcriptional/translational regulatory protein YebC/TACO1